MAEVEKLSEYSILIVDDMPANLGIITEYLEDYNFEIMIARSGESALQRAKDTQPDIILLDVQMPGIDGFETCRRLKANQITQPIPVIFMTALTSVEDKVKGFEAGAVDYVTKPIQQQEIVARINTHLRIEQQARELKETNETLFEKIDQLQRLQAQLLQQEKLAILGKLASGVAHELRNPLAVIANAVYFLQMTQNNVDDIGTEYLGILGSQVAETERLIAALLDFSQTRLPLPETVSIPELVDAVLERITPSSMVKLNRELPVDLPPVLVDRIQFEQQILTHLINNAYEAMPNGGDLTISAMTEGECARISVTDTGLGMSAEVMSQIFEPLFTTKAKGIGLGLAISQKLIEINGGRIEVSSIEGDGSRFTLILPLA